MGGHRNAGMEKRGPQTLGPRACVPLAAMLLVAGLGITPAHAGGGAGHSHHEPSAALIATLLLAASALGIAVAGRCRRPAAILTLGLLVGLFGVESAVHSVHHFADPQGAASCALFAASQHDDNAGGAGAITEVPTWTVEPSPPPAIAPIGSLQAFRSHEGRAPPVLPPA